MMFSSYVFRRGFPSAAVKGGVGAGTVIMASSILSSVDRKAVHTATTKYCYPSFNRFLVQKLLQQQQQRRPVLFSNTSTKYTFSSTTSTTTTTSTTVEAAAKTATTETAKVATETVKSAATANAETATAGKTAATSSNSGGGGGFLAWYESHLEANPVFTKMVTGCFLWGIGDAVAQVVPKVSSDDETIKNRPYDWPRTGRAAFFGFALHAPLSHVHFNLLEYMTVRAGLTGYSIPIFKAFMEQFVYWSWFSNSLYHGAMGALQGMNMQQCYKRIEDLLWETQIAQWKFWIPVQLLNFQFIPVRHQLNVVLLTSIVWTALLSAWYPPEEDDNNDNSNKKQHEEEEFLKAAATKPE